MIIFPIFIIGFYLLLIFVSNLYPPTPSGRRRARVFFWDNIFSIILYQYTSGRTARRTRPHTQSLPGWPGWGVVPGVPGPPGRSLWVILMSFWDNVLAVKPHISIQNMIWVHPHEGKTHQESFVDTLRPPKHRFRWVLHGFMMNFWHFSKNTFRVLPYT